MRISQILALSYDFLKRGLRRKWASPASLALSLGSISEQVQSTQSSSEALLCLSCPHVSQQATSSLPAPTRYKGRKSQMKPRLINSQQNCPSGLMGQHISARMKERTSKGMPPFFIELGDELIIVYWDCVILGPSNVAKT